MVRIIEACDERQAKRGGPIGGLHFAHEVKVLCEHPGHDRLQVRLAEHSEGGQAVQQRAKRRLVPCRHELRV